MIFGTVIGDKEVIAKLKGLSGAVRSELTKSIWRVILRLQRHVVEDKLTGQVLHVRSGTLRRSINADVKDSGAKIIGTVGTNVKYAKVHEYGFTGAQNVKAHLRMMKVAFGRPVKEPRQIQVGGHSRQVNYPERSFLRSALKDMAPEIAAELEAAMSRAVKGA